MFATKIDRQPDYQKNFFEPVKDCALKRCHACYFCINDQCHNFLRNNRNLEGETVCKSFGSSEVISGITVEFINVLQNSAAKARERRQSATFYLEIHDFFELCRSQSISNLLWEVLSSKWNDLRVGVSASWSQRAVREQKVFFGEILTRFNALVAVEPVSTTETEKRLYAALGQFLEALS